jgi:hypothetical protein
MTPDEFAAGARQVLTPTSAAIAPPPPPAAPPPKTPEQIAKEKERKRVEDTCDWIDRLEREQRELRAKRTLGQSGVDRLLAIQRSLPVAFESLTMPDRWTAWEKAVHAAMPGLEPHEAKLIALYAPVDGDWADGGDASWKIMMAFEDPSPVLPKKLNLLPDAEAAMRTAAEKIKLWPSDRCQKVAAFIRGTRVGGAPR